MTREEAKRILEFDLDHTHNDESKEALRIAIKALEQKPCEDAISRKSAIEAFQMFREYESNRNNKEWVDRTETVLNQLPPVNPRPKTGYWIDVDGDNAICSCCNRLNHLYGTYCKHCGAKMVEPQESEVSDADSN